MGRKISNLAIQAANDKTKLKIIKSMSGLSKVPHSKLSIYNLNSLFPSSILFLDVFRIKSNISYDMCKIEDEEERQ